MPAVQISYEPAKLSVSMRQACMIHEQTVLATGPCRLAQSIRHSAVFSNTLSRHKHLLPTRADVSASPRACATVMLLVNQTSISTCSVE